MKRIWTIVSIAAMAIGAVAAQNSAGEKGIVYAFPHTAIYLDIEYEVCERHAGPMAEYASVMAMNNAVTTTDTVYRLVSVSTGTHTTPDTTRRVTVLPMKGLQTQLIALNRHGILAGYNTPVEEEKSTSTKKSPSRPRTETPKAMPLNEEALSAEGEERAEIIRQQILHLREARTFLLLGESESQPTDGNQLELLLRELHEEEMALTALFAGQKVYRRETRRIYFTPTANEEAVVCRFSAEHGIVDAKGEGTPLRIVTLMHRPQIPALASPEKGKKAQPTAIYYNLPGSCDYTLFYGEEQLLSRSIDVAQIGVAIPLSNELLTPATHIQFSTRTGNILSITQ